MTSPFGAVFLEMPVSHRDESYESPMNSLGKRTPTLQALGKRSPQAWLGKVNRWGCHGFPRIFADDLFGFWNCEKVRSPYGTFGPQKKPVFFGGRVEGLLWFERFKGKIRNGFCWIRRFDQLSSHPLGKWYSSKGQDHMWRKWKIIEVIQCLRMFMVTGKLKMSCSSIKFMSIIFRSKPPNLQPASALISPAYHRSLQRRNCWTLPAFRFHCGPLAEGRDKPAIYQIHKMGNFREIFV